MKIIFSRNILIFIALAVALFITFIFTPSNQIIFSSDQNDLNVNTCPTPKLCNSEINVSLYNYLISGGSFEKINWGVILNSLILLFLLFYVELRLLKYILTPQKKRVVKQIIALAAIIIIPFIYHNFFLFFLVSPFFLIFILYFYMFSK